jgi:hypothetical protein
MKWCKKRHAVIALLAVLACVTTVQAVFTPDGYERFTKKMLQRFEHGTKPPKNSIFAGSWQQDGRIYTFNIDGTMTITIPDGKWVHEVNAEGERPTAIFRIKDHARALYMKDETIVLDEGDTWSELKRVPKNNIEPKTAITQDKAEQAGADQPATKPADKTPVKIQPSTPTSKDGPR